MTKPSEATSNEQEVPARFDIGVDSLILAWEGDYMLYADHVNLRARLLAEIAQLKEELAGEQEVYVDTNKALNHVTSELSSTRDKMAMLVDVLESCAHAKSCATTDRDAFDDRQQCTCGRDAALSATSAEVEKHRAERDAKALEDAITELECQSKYPVPNWHIHILRTKVESIRASAPQPITTSKE